VRTASSHQLWSYALLLAAGACGQEQAAPAQEIGASLNDKVDVAIKDAPKDVLAVAKAARPNIAFTEAEREVKNDTIYYDIGGVDGNGDEIELDIMQDGDGWRVVEIQRDISLDQTPEAVRDALFANAPDVKPARIIESDQGDGVIIYEFYTVADDGTEQKFEIKLEGENAEFLTEEWVH